MRTPDELIEEGECDEMALGCLSVLAELRRRFGHAMKANPELRDATQAVIDDYANEIYGEFAD